MSPEAQSSTAPTDTVRSGLRDDAVSASAPEGRLTFDRKIKRSVVCDSGVGGEVWWW